MRMKMESVLLKSNSNSDIELILILAKKLGIEIAKIEFSDENMASNIPTRTDLKHNFFESKGIWKNRDIDAKMLRKEAWKIQD